MTISVLGLKAEGIGIGTAAVLTDEHETGPAAGELFEI